MTVDLLDLALDELVARCDDEPGDWADVLRRAGTQTASRESSANASSRRLLFRRRPGRRNTLALALLAVFAVLLATPAFGVQGAILRLLGRIDIPFSSTKPAPTLVRRQFADLGFGAPPSMAPQAIISQARTVTTFHVDGKSHTLWVAPTRRGGFCWTISEAFGGCLNLADIKRAQRHYKIPTGEIHPELLSVSFTAASPNSSTPAEIEGVVLAPKATRLTADFRDGRSIDLPFVFVSPPINAGFVLWQIPASHLTRGAALRAVSAYDAHGKLIARALIPVASGPVRVRPKVPPKTVTAPPPPSPLGFHLPNPTAPFQRGSGDGTSITVGANGVVIFNTSGIDAARRALMRGRLGVGCFKIEHDALGIWPRELTVLRGFGQLIKIRLFGVPHPYDGCEIEATYGHTWPDKLGSHSAIEIPLTATGRAFFADRAAARDLALFVRSHRGHALRQETGVTLRHDLARIAPRLVPLSSSGARPPVGKIGYTVTPRGVTFVEISSTGKRFQVVIADGRIAAQNVKPYTLVF